MQPNEPEVGQAIVYLFNIDEASDLIEQMLTSIIRQNEVIEDLSIATESHCEDAMKAIREAKGTSKRLLTIFLHLEDHATYLPMVSKPFDADDADYVQRTVNDFFKALIDIGNTSFQLKTLETGDFVLSMCIQALLENNMMALHLRRQNSTGQMC
jgi:hypothetical protein